MSLLNNKLYSKNIHRFTHQAMNTIFEIIINDEEKEYAGQTAAAAFQEIDRLEEELSRFIPNSEVSRINNLSVGEELKLSPDIFECLKIADYIYNITGGIFDVTSGQIIDKWKVKNNNISTEDFSNIEIGMDKIILDETYFSLTVTNKNLMIDLGGIGKGFAIDKTCELLTEWDISNAVIHSGSTVKAIGKLSGYDGWPVTISNPVNNAQTIAEIIIKDSSLSGSGNRNNSHIINPKTSLPVKDRTGTWSIAESAAISDAMSTAFMIMPLDDIEKFCKIHNYISGLIIIKNLPNISRSDIFYTNNLNSNTLLI